MIEAGLVAALAEPVLQITVRQEYHRMDPGNAGPHEQGMES